MVTDFKPEYMANTYQAKYCKQDTIFRIIVKMTNIHVRHEISFDMPFFLDWWQNNGVIRVIVHETKYLN